jgi:hypothetical protein
VAAATLAALTAAVLAAAGQPAVAAPPGPALAEPAPAEQAAADAGRPGARSAERPRQKHPNPLLRETLPSKRGGAPRPDPAVSALCQSYLGKPNPYRSPAPNVNTIVGDTVVPIGSQAGCAAAQNETTIAVNPYNPRNLVAGANDYRLFNDREQRNDGAGFAYTTFDGGKTWENVLAPKLVYHTGATGALSYMDGAGDPALAFGPHNVVYYANLVFSRADAAPGQQRASGITVSVSRDGGRTFAEPAILQLDGVNPDGTPAPAGVFNDKEWIAADPFTGTVYVTWTRFTYDAAGNYLESPIVVSRSTDFGRTWSEPTRVSPSLAGFTGGLTPYAQGSNPQVGRDGTLYVAYEASICATIACTGADDHDAVVVSTSRDGGRTFGHVEVATNFNFPATLTGQNFRLNSFPLAAYDAVTDQLWLTWADDRNGRYDDGRSVRTNGDVFVVSSRGGRNWSAPARVGTATDEFFPAVAVFASRVVVSYYTRMNDPYGIGVDYAYSAGWGRHIDGAAVRRITTETQNPQVQFVSVAPDGSLVQGVFIGDYTGVAMGYDFVAHPIWTDFRGRPGVNTPNQDAYTQAIFALF